MTDRCDIPRVPDSSTGSRRHARTGQCSDDVRHKWKCRITWGPTNAPECNYTRERELTAANKTERTEEMRRTAARLRRVLATDGKMQRSTNRDEGERKEMEIE